MFLPQVHCLKPVFSIRKTPSCEILTKFYKFKVWILFKEIRYPFFFSKFNKIQKKCKFTWNNRYHIRHYLLVHLSNSLYLDIPSTISSSVVTIYVCMQIFNNSRNMNMTTFFVIIIVSVYFTDIQFVWTRKCVWNLQIYHAISCVICGISWFLSNFYKNMCLYQTFHLIFFFIKFTIEQVQSLVITCALVLVPELSDILSSISYEKLTTKER